MSGTNYTQTPNYGLYKPIANADVNQWGAHLNLNTDAIDSLIHTAAKLGNVKDYGAIMDGSSHPLSTQYATLAAAQAVYPHALALTDEIDWCAIQAAVNAGNSAILVPAGTAIINRPVVSSTVPLVVRGAGQGITDIVQTAAGQDGWQHTSSQSFAMFDLDLRCTGACGVGLNMNFAGSATLFTVRDVSISGYVNSATDYWHDGIKCVGCNRTSIERVLVAGIVGPLASVGNGIYLAPSTTPTVAGSFIIAIQDAIINNYQSAVVLDSTGRASNTNLQGIVLDWVNSNGCMQFVTCLGITLELVLHKCQAQTFGAIIHADDAQTVVVRDCYFILWPATANAIAAQLPQDVFYINGGGNWMITDSRIVLSGGPTIGFVVNVLNSAGGVYVKDNTVYVTGTTTTSGFISIGSGCHHVFESNTSFSFWNAAWPYCVNANANGGTANLVTLGAMGAGQPTPFGNDQLQNQGSYITWNYPAASGNMALFASHGGGLGGFNFYNAPSTNPSTPVLLAAITSNGVFASNGLITKNTPVTGTTYSLAATDSSLVLTPTGTFTLTLGTAAAGNTGRIVSLKSTAAFAVNSNTNNIVQLTGGASTNAIFPATAGKWCVLQSDGAAWQIMQAG